MNGSSLADVGVWAGKKPLCAGAACRKSCQCQSVVRVWLQELEGGSVSALLLHRGTPADLVHQNQVGCQKLGCQTRVTERSGTWVKRWPRDTCFELMDIFLLLLE